MAASGTRSRQRSGRTGDAPRRRSSAPAGPPRSLAIGGVLLLWRTAARGVGAAARAIGRNAASARELDAAHRRDGAALGIIALGLVSSIAVWFHAAGPVGVGLTELLRLFVGNGALALPVAFFLLGIHMLRQVPIPGQRGRLLVGTVTLSAAVLGLLHLWSDSPTSRSGRSVSGGLIGAGVATPVERGLSAVVAVPLLFLLGGFGILVLTATPLAQLVHQAWALTRWRPKSRSRGTANRGAVLGVDDAGTGPIPVVAVGPDPSETSPEPSHPVRARRSRPSRSATEPEQHPISRSDPVGAQWRRRHVYLAVPQGTAYRPAPPATHAGERRGHRALSSRCSPSSTSTAPSPGSIAARP